MYELLTGNVPFKGDNAVEIALKHLKDKIPSIRKQNPAIPQSVENILLKAAAKNPRNRYESAKDMYEDFIHCLDEEHANDKKIVFEYPENDLDATQPIETVKPKPIKKVVEKPATEDTDELVKEITEEDIIKAIAYINNIYIDDTGDCLIFLSALNLCNAYVKQNNSKITYSFKKGIEYIIDILNYRRLKNIYINRSSNLFIFQIGHIQFSFHDEKKVEINNNRSFLCKYFVRFMFVFCIKFVSDN